MGRTFKLSGVPDWEEILPDKICEKCVLREKECSENQTCAALRIITVFAVQISAKSIMSDNFSAKNFMENLKKAINGI